MLRDPRRGFCGPSAAVAARSRCEQKIYLESLADLFRTSRRHRRWPQRKPDDQQPPIPHPRRLRRRCLGEAEGRDASGARCRPAPIEIRRCSWRTRLRGGSPDRAAAFLMPCRFDARRRFGGLGSWARRPLFRGRRGRDASRGRRHADTGSGFRSRTSSALRLVAHAVQLALPRNRWRCDRERSQHRPGSRSVDPQRRHRARPADSRSVLRPRPPFARTRPPRLRPGHRARPLALSDPARPQARPPAQLAGLVPRRRRPPLSSRRRRISLRVRARQFLRLLRAPRGRSCGSRSGQALAWPRAGRWSWI